MSLRAKGLIDTLSGFCVCSLCGVIMIIKCHSSSNNPACSWQVHTCAISLTHVVPNDEMGCIERSGDDIRIEMCQVILTMSERLPNSKVVGWPALES